MPDEVSVTGSCCGAIRGIEITLHIINFRRRPRPAATFAAPPVMSYAAGTARKSVVTRNFRTIVGELACFC
jgi:hypothetical protein